jgi:hypothetical protein
MEFDLNATIRSVIESRVGPEPSAIAEKVMELIPFGQEREIFAPLLRNQCRLVSISYRNQLRSRNIVADLAAIENGEEPPLREGRGILDVPYRVEAGWVLQRHMGKSDHFFIAEEHHTEGTTRLFLATVHRAIGERIPEGQTTEEVFTEEQLAAMFRRTA